MNDILFLWFSLVKGYRVILYITSKGQTMKLHISTYFAQLIII